MFATVLGPFFLSRFYLDFFMSELLCKGFDDHDAEIHMSFHRLGSFELG
jgi:hypothetical protein